MVDQCLEMLGHYELPEDTHGMLVANVTKGGEIHTDDDEFAPAGRADPSTYRGHSRISYGLASALGVLAGRSHS